MIRWLRIVVPPIALVAAGTVFLILEALFLALEWHLKVPFHSFEDGGIFIRVMDFFAIFYALFRLRAFHPGLQRAYHNWLSLTPWTYKKPLPLGPVHLVLQDVLLLSIAVGLCWPRAGTGSLDLVKTFLICYLGGLCFAHVNTGQKAWAYPLAFGLGFMVLFVRTPWYFAFAGASYVIAFLGLRASLSRFPWRDELLLDRLKLMSGWKLLGWPFGRLGPKRSMQLKLSDVFLTGILAGWAIFVVASALNDSSKTAPMVIVLANMLVFYGAFARIVVYCNNYLPPLSLLGRLALGRLIIPGYDKVFVAPILAVLVFQAAAAMPFWSDVSHHIAAAIGVTASWWILLGMGPSLDAWRLTGNHRIVRGLVLEGGIRKR